MQPEKRNLLDDVMTDGGAAARRESILRAGGKIMRRRRAVRFASRTLGLVAVVLLAAVVVYRKPALPKPTLAHTQKTVPTPEQVQYLTDDQLLAFFHDVPVGLLKMPDGKKRLIFLRPGDEAKYVIHL
jgi:hypothetical protein